jgi:hypothetical protein
MFDDKTSHIKCQDCMDRLPSSQTESKTNTHTTSQRYRFVTSGWEAGANAMASTKTKAEGGKRK